MEEEMVETPPKSTILSSLIEVLPGTFAFDWFASESPKHVSQSQCARAENNTRIATKECLEKEQYDTPLLCFVLYSFQFSLFGILYGRVVGGGFYLVNVKASASA